MVRIYGSSDDLIEIDGDWSEEIGLSASGSDDDPGLLACSDGTVLEYEYDRAGCWRFKRVVSGSAAFSKTEAVSPDSAHRPDGTPGYSDVVTLDGDVRWVARANQKDVVRK